MSLRPLPLLLAFLLLPQAHAQPARPAARPTIRQVPRPTAPAPEPGYARGFPAPGATPAGTGATYVGPPDNPQLVPRSPGRILPPGAQPELWAGASTPAVASGNRKLLGFTLPDLAGLPRAEGYPEHCALNVLNGLTNIEPGRHTAWLAEGEGAMSAAQRACAAAWLYDACLRNIPDKRGWEEAKVWRATARLAAEQCNKPGVDLLEVAKLTSWLQGEWAKLWEALARTRFPSDKN